MNNCSKNTYSPLSETLFLSSVGADFDLLNVQDFSHVQQQQQKAQYVSF